MQNILSWTAREFMYKEKTSNWFWSLGIIAVASAVAAFILGNILFGILILIGAFVMALYAEQKPRLINFALTERGVTIGSVLYPYQSLKSFWVEDNEENPLLLIESQKVVVPLITIPLSNVRPEKVREYLQKHLEEKEQAAPVSHSILEYFGF